METQLLERMAMFELSLLCPEDRVETISEALDALDALSVSVEDADAQTEAEQALFGEPGMPANRVGRGRRTAMTTRLASSSKGAICSRSRQRSTEPCGD